MEGERWSESGGRVQVEVRKSEALLNAIRILDYLHTLGPAPWACLGLFWAEAPLGPVMGRSTG